jgi:ABC-type multidrug transport system fused ATPase/permease subunit
VVKAYRMEAREQREFAGGAERLFQNVKRTITGTSAVTAFATVIVGAIGVLLIFFGGRAIQGGAMTLGDLVMYVAFISVLVGPIVQMSSIGTQISEAFAGLDRIRDIMNLEAEDAHDDGLTTLPELRGHVTFKDVFFEYEQGQPVLRGVSLDAPAGTTTALVGSSGSGKSTLVSLIMAFSRPTSGQVLVDGRDLISVRLGDYRKHLGVVLQENFLFDGTVAENIRFARPDATLERVQEVARLANADTFIKGFPQGYDSIVGERGIKLSGGQRQRIAIARALLADPKILILDEATSSLDSESEALIQEGLERLQQGRTTFVIAHRLSTIRKADQILVLEAGEIVERGTHTQLLKAGGRYRTLHDKQYQWEKNVFVNPGEDYQKVP